VKDPAQLTLKEVAAAIRRRKLSSVELTRSLLERIARWQPALNAFVRVEAEDALAAAKAADRALARRGAKGPLHGVPLAHKDMYYSAGKPAGCGSKVREGWIAPVTSTAIVRLEAAGSFRLGALHMSEFAYSPTGHNSYLGPAHNPWDASRITGGSSSGSGAAVAARLTHAALGSDTGGSIRLPAHFCGVTGFKPTYGRVSRANALPLSFTLDTVGPLAQTAEDCALITALIAGPDPLDPTTAGAPAWNAKAAKRSPKGLKIGVPTRFYVDDLEPDVAAALDAALAAFTRLGAKIVKVELPDQTALSAAALIVLAVEATSAHAPWLRTRAADYGLQVRNRLENGLAYSAIEYLEALRWRAPALAAHLGALGDVDVVIAPASRLVAPTIEETDVGGGPDAEAAIQAVTRFMRPVNYLGLPTLVVPAGQSRQGLPIGLQLIGRPFGDETLIALGAAFQNATDHHRRMPAPP
jgi:aspartyl-tRNA(Asn)/glutamyl-tRNA(Gln) amidotransferase subunit A